MAFDSIPWNDPDRPVCPKCSRTIAQGDLTTIMYFQPGGSGDQDMNGKPWHAECARPYWDKMSGVLDQLNRLTGLF